MRSEIHLVCCALVAFGGWPQTGGQSHASPIAFASAPFPALTATPTPPDTTELPVKEFPQRTLYPAGGNETSGHLTATAPTKRTVESETSADAGHLHVSSSTAATVTTLSLSGAADNLSSTPTAVSSTAQHATVRSHLSDDQTLSTFPSRTVPAVQDPGSAAPTSTAPTSTSQPQPAVATRTTAHPQTSGPGWAAVGPTHREFPSELNIGDDDLKGSHHHSNSPLDPLLAGLLSVFIVTTAVVFTVLFFKFRQRVNHPEFHRLQDLPMDDLMEDTPLSRYAH